MTRAKPQLILASSSPRRRQLLEHSRNIEQSEILAYWNTGEPRDKAGGYAIQGIGALFVSRLEGSYSGAMGLPLFETAELLKKTGLNILSDI